MKVKMIHPIASPTGVALELSVAELRRFVKSQQRNHDRWGEKRPLRPGGVTETLTNALAEIDGAR